MLFLVAAAYGLLALRVSIRLDASFCDGQGSFLAKAGVLGIWFRFDGLIAPDERGVFWRILPRYGRPFWHRSARRKMALRVILSRVRAAVRLCRVESLSLAVRLGLDDAAQTAVACGAVRMLVQAAAARMGVMPTELRIQPSFSGACAYARLRGIFSFRLGDAVFAAVTAALRKRQGEGFLWKSIPLRA